MKDTYYSWPTDVLVKYVVKARHAEINAMLSETKDSFDELVAIYGDHHPQLQEAHQLFFSCAWAIEAHLLKEAVAVLPFVKRYSEELKKYNRLRKPRLLSACPTIDKMYHEHQAEEKRFEQLMDLMRGVVLSGKGTILFETTWQKLQVLRRQWHELAQLEDNILFPNIIEMESILNPM